MAMFRGGASFADAITFGAEKVDKKLADEFAKVKGKKVLKYDEAIPKFSPFYKIIISPNIYRVYI